MPGWPAVLRGIREAFETSHEPAVAERKSRQLQYILSSYNTLHGYCPYTAFIQILKLLVLRTRLQ